MSATPLFILPGLICDLAMFEATLRAFPGSAGVDDFYGDNTDLGAMAEHALTHAAAHAPDRFILLGHSMGARIALETIRRAPHRVAALILADTGIHPVQPGEQDKRYALRDVGRAAGFAALVDQWLPPMLAPASRDDAALLADLRTMCLRASQARFEEQTQALLTRPDVEALLPAIACPTLSIGGALDAWSPPAQHERIAAHIPGAHLHIVPGAGHMLPAEAPEAFIAAIRHWLGRHDPQ